MCLSPWYLLRYLGCSVVPGNTLYANPSLRFSHRFVVVSSYKILSLFVHYLMCIYHMGEEYEGIRFNILINEICVKNNPKFNRMCPQTARRGSRDRMSLQDTEAIERF